MKLYLNMKMRIQSKYKYQFFEIPEMGVEVNIPSEYVVGYPNDEQTYLTLDGLLHLEEELTSKLQNKSVSVEIKDENIEEGW